MHLTIPSRRLRRAVVLTATLILAAPGTLPAQQAANPGLDSARALLSKYRDPMAAVHDGYLSSMVCMSFSNGAMGVHFLNASTIGPTVDPARPQVLIYEPVGNDLQLVAAEWFVPLATGVTAAPVLFGEKFDGPMDGHAPIMPPDLRHYDLHVWLFKANPLGTFSLVNPDVKCTGYRFGHAESTPATRVP